MAGQRTGRRAALHVAILVGLTIVPTGAATHEVLREIGADGVSNAHWVDAEGAMQRGVSGAGVAALTAEGFDGFHAALTECALAGYQRVSIGISTGVEPVDQEAAINDESGHGTMVAGIMCAADQSRHPGVAPSLRLMSWAGLCTVCDRAAWLDEPALRILQSSTLDDLADDYVDDGLNDQHPFIYVQGAGNGGGDGMESQTFEVRRDLVPVLLVAASDTGFDRVASYSSRGARSDSSTWPDIAAPACMWAPRPTYGGYTAPVFWTNWLQQEALESYVCRSLPLAEVVTEYSAGYAWAFGTSAASPVVAGVLALMFEVHMNMTAQDAWTLITQTAEPFLPTEDTDGDGRISADEFYAQNGWEAGYGRVDAAAAVGASHYLSLHPDGGTHEALGCFVVAQDPDGQTWLNPDEASCGQAPPGWTLLRAGTGVASDPGMDDRQAKGASGLPLLLLVAAVVGAARMRRR